MPVLSPGVTPVVRVQGEDFDLSVEQSRLTSDATGVGAVVAFTGLCRDEGGRLAALELEHYPGMAEAEITRICKIAVERWPVTGLTAVHRYGRIAPGGNIVLVLAASAHRQAAFDAANFVMDYLKTSAPFWKKEHFADGSEGAWVSAKEADDDALRRWSTPAP
jgi:molybdopterin synthase catalytic subunit